MTAALPPIHVHICATCRSEAEPDHTIGQRLRHEITAALGEDHPDIIVSMVECLSVCKTPGAVAISGAGRWTYVYAGLDAAIDAAPLADGLIKYAATEDGLVPWRQRPDVMKRKVIARIPALPVVIAEPATSPLKVAAE